MNSALRLLISARDPGAANHLLPVAKAALADPLIDLILVADHPAHDIFQDAGIQVQLVAPSDWGALQTASRLIAREQPDVILVGLSGPGRGIDEALLAASDTQPTFALQDFWGDVNRGFGRIADTYLVRDELAARMTRRATGAHTIITGLPGNNPPPAWRQNLMDRKLRDRCSLADGTPLLALFTQPLWQYPEYRATLRDTLQQLPHGHLRVRMHPKDTRNDHRTLRKMLNRHCPIDWSFSDEHFDALLSSADMVLSAFSNTGIDKALFNSRSLKRGGVPVFLLQNRALQQRFSDWTGLKEHPLSEQGACLSLHSSDSLKTKLKQGMAPAIGAITRRASRGLLGTGDNVTKILTAVLKARREATTPSAQSA